MNGDNTLLYQTDDRLRRMEQEQGEMREVIYSLKESQQAISSSLERLVRLEEQHVETREAIARAFSAIEKISVAMHEIRIQVPTNLDTRLRGIEANMPGLIEMRRWVTAGVLSVVGLIGAAIIGGIIRVGI